MNEWMNVWYLIDIIVSVACAYIYYFSSFLNRGWLSFLNTPFTLDHPNWYSPLYPLPGSDCVYCTFHCHWDLHGCKCHPLHHCCPPNSHGVFFFYGSFSFKCFIWIPVFPWDKSQIKNLYSFCECWFINHLVNIASDPVLARGVPLWRRRLV